MNGPDAPEDAAAMIAALQSAFGADVWRLRRLAELGVAQAKINHDLRNLLTSAMMLADRLQGSADPKVSRAGSLLVGSIERATALIAAAQAFTTEAAPLLARSRFPLSALIAELAEELRAEHGHVTVENGTPDHLHLEADRPEFARAIGHLLRSAAKAEARRVAVHVEHEASVLAIVLTDDGRPFQSAAATGVFRPFSGAFRYGSTGLGFVIARDVIEAHGGAITVRTRMVQTGAEDEQSTCIVLTLPA
ncbi:sensor histidine kinase [Acidisoma sp.]|uniref:sensor histidine kinase n=1 Tax=Acidisoma sp. TaxID=1872115 RepID=UPI003AFFC63C